MKKIDSLFFDAGGGHRAAANALRQVIEEQKRPWEVRLVNFQELLDSIDWFRKLTGLRLQDVYNLMLKKGWTLGSPQLTAAMHVIIRMFHSKQVELLERHWKSSRPDMVVSIIPNFNRAVAESIERAIPGTPFVTVMTDIADYPPHFWLERESGYVVCGSDRAVEQARAHGIANSRIFRTSGMIINPRFYQPVTVDRRAARQQLGLHPDGLTALVLFGGQGNRVMLDILRRLDRSGYDIQLIFICGHNEKLAKKLRDEKAGLCRFVEGFTKEVPLYMHLSDFLIGKPGPGCISEALAMKLPVIVECNAWTLPQERYNAEWVIENKVGLVVPNFRRITEPVGQLLAPATLNTFRTRAAMMQNQAVFEIPDILEDILNTSSK